MKMKFPKRQMKPLDTADKIMFALRTKRLTPSELSKIIGKSRSTISEQLYKLMGDGKVTFDKEGKERRFRIWGKRKR